MKIGERYLKRIKDAEDVLEKLKPVYEQLKEQYPEVLELDTSVYVERDGSMTGWPKAEDGIAARLMEIFKVEKSQHKSSLYDTNDHRSIYLKVPGIDINIVLYYKRKPCKKYRVVKEQVIESCGDIDIEDYISVEEIT